MGSVDPRNKALFYTMLNTFVTVCSSKYLLVETLNSNLHDSYKCHQLLSIIKVGNRQ
ncbi:hypothetical protein VIRA109638_12440 [Vibrio rarus]